MRQAVAFTRQKDRNIATHPHNPRNTCTGTIMRRHHFTVATMGLATILAACGETNIKSNTLSPLPAASGSEPIALAPETGIAPDAAARLAKQASFGPTLTLINTIVAKKSAAAWLEEQFSTHSSSYADISAKTLPANYCTPLTGAELAKCTQDNFSAVPVQMRLYANAVHNDDQLRQRVAFALSQIIVASDIDIHNTSGLATFQQIFLDNSFGNYRDILKEVTLNPYMGDYLDLAYSEKSLPNENYARELMQLFSMGSAMLNPDGTAQTDNNGSVIPSYSITDIKEISRALTGWTYVRLTSDPAGYNNRNWSKPMEAFSARFDSGSKTFLGRTIPSGATQQTNLDAVVDTVFNHPNTAPYICKRLIQQLTVANPTPAYVERVAAAFANNGAGVRGDMKAVIRAIYLDSEARTVSQLPGKVKEPVLLETALARAIGFKTDGYAFVARHYSMGQEPFRAPSVFNFYPYEFPLPQGAGLVSPVSRLMTTSTIISRHNFVYDWTILGDASRSEYQKQTTITGAIGTIPDWASWEALGTDDGKIVDRVNLVLLNGTMTPSQRQSLLAAMAQIKNSDPNAQSRKRAQLALYVVASSPLFQVDR